ncbi:hypothetical protein NYG89_08700 [Campylobacter felis]|uniref:hypothetical protein n=1 Tax=Campylobacter felis TaxID=2974565 RepID=UPI0025653AF0|nr:hypothetical protein [Campylobacter felis]
MLRFFISSFLKRSFVWRKKQTKALGRRARVNLALCVREKARHGLKGEVSLFQSLF